jgi:hypothetical protein
VVRVSGTLTRGGQPVPYMTVNFMPEAGRPSWGVSDEAGRFELEYDDRQKGALAGSHTVWVAWRPRSPQEEMAAQGMKKGKVNRPSDLAEITAKYGTQQKSPLKVRIDSSVSDLEVKLD